MLVLTRRVGEVVMIEETVEVTVVEIKGQQVRLAFYAPKVIAIHRKEVYERIQEEKKAKMLNYFAETSVKR